LLNEAQRPYVHIRQRSAGGRSMGIHAAAWRIVCRRDMLTCASVGLSCQNAVDDFLSLLQCLSLWASTNKCQLYIILNIEQNHFLMPPTYRWLIILLFGAV
jgi:hypothetical protein